MKNKIVVALYAHPEGYSPVLNMLAELSKLYREVHLAFRPLFSLEWPYPENVRLHESGAKMTVREQEQLPTPLKIKLFFGFCRELRRLIRSEKPEVFLAIDPMASLAMHWIKGFLGYRPMLWYHNQDVVELHLTRKYSLMWFAKRAEPKLFQRLDIFSLPANERAEYFPMKKLKGKYFFIPNMPSTTTYGEIYNPNKGMDKVRILFMGHVGPMHGIEEIMDMMPFSLSGKPVHLVLKGHIRPGIRENYERLIREKNLEEHVEMVGYTAYQEVPKLTGSCHIGIAIFTKDDIMNRTLGTASSKIYEYAAAGLPIIYYDSPHYRKHLGQYKWAFAADLSAASLRDCMEKIVEDFPALSQQANASFRQRLNYQHQFRDIANFLTTN